MKDYRHAQDVWRTFRLRTMGDYHDLYLRSDVLLLALSPVLQVRSCPLLCQRWSVLERNAKNDARIPRADD